MKATLTALMLCLLPALADEPALKLEKLTLKSGKEYQQVVVTAKRPDGISITYADGGLARIPFEQLPDDVAKQLGGFDPAAGKEAREKADTAEAATIAAIDRDMAVQGAKDATTKNEKKAADADKAASKNAVMLTIQVTNGGALCHLAWISKTGVGGFSNSLSFVEGITGADDQRLQGVIVPAGLFYYTTILGVEETVTKWRLIGATSDPGDLFFQAQRLRFHIAPAASSSQRIGAG